jgi:hypothetical protein
MNLIFYGWWADYEENSWLIICEKKGQYYTQEGGHSVMGEDEEQLDFEPITEEEALELMVEWAEHEDDDPITIEEILKEHTS